MNFAPKLEVACSTLLLLFPRPPQYAASGLCGKAAPVGGWWNTYPIPFYRSVRVTVRADDAMDGDGCKGGYVNVRGTPGLPLRMPGAGWELPPGTKLTLHKNPLHVVKPLSFVELLSLPQGCAPIHSISLFRLFGFLCAWVCGCLCARARFV